MRILLKLIALKNCIYDLKYFHKIQGFIYNLLKGTEYESLHDRLGYKFFCFSNVFPIGDIKIGDLRNLLISSPNDLFIETLEKKLNELKIKEKPINFGEMLFKIESLSLMKIKLKKNLKLVSSTPIIIRIPEKNYEKYAIPENYRKKRFVYWRPQYSFEAFVKQLEGNLIKKYEKFYGKCIKIDRIFEIFKFKKSTVNHVIINGKEQKLVGSIWEFYFSYLDEMQKKILEFGIDCGFGERNSLGFGFMNVVNI